MRPMSEVSRILSAVEQGDPHAAAELLPLVYKELRELAAAKLAQEKTRSDASGCNLRWCMRALCGRLVDGHAEDAATGDEAAATSSPPPRRPYGGF